MAFLRRPAVRVTLITVLVLYLCTGPVELVRVQTSLAGTLTALAAGAALLGCALPLIFSRVVSGRNALLLLVIVAGAAALHAIEPYTGLAFSFFAAFATPHRTRLRAAIPLTVLLLVTLPLVSYLTGFSMAAAMGMTTGLAYTVVVSFSIWYVSATKRQTAEVAEARAGEAVLQERARLAREVHDILAHAQSAQIVHLEGARVLLRTGADPARALDRVERAVHLARAGLEETRRALDALRGTDLPLPERLERLAAEFRASTGASCALTVDAGVDELPAEAKLAVARTAQEALTNVRKHAPGASVTVSLRRLGPWCDLEVRDDGGPPPANGRERDDTHAGYGLIGMRERAELIGGSLTAGAGDGGFAVLLRVPA